MSVATLANATTTVERPTDSRDTIGGVTKSWAEVLRLRGRVQPRTAADILLHAREEGRVTHRIYYSGVPDVRHTDRIKVDGQTATGRSLYVIGVRDVDFAGRHLEVDAEERPDA